MTLARKKFGVLAVITSAILLFGFGLDYLLRSSGGSEESYIRQAKEAGSRQDWPSLLSIGQKWLLINPKSAAAYAALGDAYRMQGRAKESMGAYGQSLSINQNQFQVWTYYGADAFNLGNFADAALSCENSVKLNPAYGEGWFCLATAHAFSGNHTGLDAAAAEVKKSSSELYGRLQSVVTQHACVNQKSKLGKAWCAQ